MRIEQIRVIRGFRVIRQFQFFVAAATETPLFC